MLSQGFSPGGRGSFYSPGWPFEQQDRCSQGLCSPAFLAPPPYPCPNTTKERSSAPTEPPQVFFANSPNLPLSHPCCHAQSCSDPPFPKGSECCPWGADGSGGASVPRMVRQKPRCYSNPLELQGSERRGRCRCRRSEVDLRCSSGEQGMPLGSISLQAEVKVSPGAETSDRALAQLGWCSHPPAVGCCLCHSHLLRARGTKQACAGKKKLKKK